MKWIKKNILVIIAIFMILTIVLIYLLYDNSVYSQIKKEFRIDVTNCKKIKSKDTHGGFHGMELYLLFLIVHKATKPL